jgi:hypothetical protein
MRAQSGGTVTALIVWGERSHDVEFVTLDGLGRRVLKVVMRLVIHVPIISSMHAVVVTVQACYTAGKT